MRIRWLQIRLLYLDFHWLEYQGYLELERLFAVLEEYSAQVFVFLHTLLKEKIYYEMEMLCLLRI
jgi:hypothetical protein